MNILIKPIITEKSMFNASRGVYTFMVERGSNKHQIKEAVEGLFAVKVMKVNTSLVTPAEKRTGRLRLKRSSPSVKTARVTLKAGQSIELFDLKEEK